MSKKVTAVTIWSDAVGERMSIAFSEIDDGKIVKDNGRTDRVIDDDLQLKAMATIKDAAQKILDGMEG